VSSGPAAKQKGGGKGWAATGELVRSRTDLIGVKKRKSEKGGWGKDINKKTGGAEGKKRRDFTPVEEKENKKTRSRG